MSSQEIFNFLKKYANFELKKLNGNIYGFGSIIRCPECRGASNDVYMQIYHNYAEKLESLPWTSVVKDPRSPKEGEYPIKEGVYITMMDCNHHEVCTNTFRNGHFIWMNRTHIKWWMPMPNIE